MAHIEVHREGKLIRRQPVDEAEVRTGYKVRFGSQEVQLSYGESRSVGPDTLIMVTDEQLEPYPPTAQPDASPLAMSESGAMDPILLIPVEQPPSAENLRISGYQVLAPLGKGGMGTVWKAIQLSTKRTVALKLMGSQFTSGKVQLRFEREVELTARLNHPNIAKVYDSGLFQGHYYYVMEYIPGVTLTDFVGAKCDSPNQILQLMLKVCMAVHHAHSKEIIHRDLKPSNILVTEDGEPHILDFGLAKSLLTDDNEVTVSIEGQVTGTPAYMSPEQARGDIQNTGMQSDVYSLGVILYRLLVGKYPRDMTGSRLEVIRRIAEIEVIPPRMVIPRMSACLEALLLKALAIEADKRYLSAGDFADDLKAYLAGDPVKARVVSPFHVLYTKIRKHLAKKAILSGILLVLIAGLGAYFWSNSQNRIELGPKHQNQFEEANPTKRMDSNAVAGTHYLSPGMSIQPVIDSARAGDELRLMPGTYPIKACLDFRGKAVLLTGTDPNDPQVVAQTVLACTAGRAFQFVSNEGPQTVIRGLTIRSGMGALIEPGSEASPPSLGGAVFCRYASPRFEFCVFEQNQAQKGGAVYALGSQMVFRHCLFSDNTAKGLTDSAGGAVLLDASPVEMTGCRFINNRCYPQKPEDPRTPGTGGGALCLVRRSDATIHSSFFRANVSSDDGGAVCCQGSAPVIRTCEFIANRVEDSGGGLYYAYHSDARLYQSVLAGNRAAMGGGLFHREEGSMLIENCTFTGNRADVGAAIRTSWRSKGTITNSILWNNNESTSAGIDIFKSELQISYCNIEESGSLGNVCVDPLFVQAGRWDQRDTPNNPNDDRWIQGDYHMCVDPLFVKEGRWDQRDTPNDPNDDEWIQGDYHLQSKGGRWDTHQTLWVRDQNTSPCIDHGNPQTPIGNEPDQAMQRINMGAYGGTHQASKYE